MPKRGIEQNLRNFEAIPPRLEPSAMVNAELLLGNMNHRALDVQDATWTVSITL